MPVTRHGPVHNMDTNEVLKLRQPHERFTRAQAHRLLRLKEIPHDPGATMEQMLYHMRMHNIEPQLTAPGIIEDKQQPQEEAPQIGVKRDWRHQIAEDGYPRGNVVLRGMCKDRGIKTTQTMKRAELVRLLQDE